MSAPGQTRGLVLRTRHDGQRFVGVSLHSTRPIGVMRVLAGKAVSEALRLVPLLYPVCGRAQVIAGLRAVEAAQAREVDDVLEVARDLLVLSEQAVSLAWRVAIDWAPIVGRKPEPEVVALVRKSAQEVRFALFGALPFDEPGATALHIDRARLGVAIADLERALGDLFPEMDMVDHLAELELHLLHGVSVPGRLIASARADELLDFGRHDADFCDHRDPAWFGERLLADAHFAAEPTVDGVVAEVGPLAGLRHPLAVEALVAWGPGLATRLLAAALDLQALPARMASLARRIVAGLTERRRATLDDGCGAGYAETARGPLVHAVVVDKGRVEDWRAVAPTEWNFHPAGPFARAVQRARVVPEAERALRMLAASFDPCVPISFDVVHVDQRAA